MQVYSLDPFIYTQKGMGNLCAGCNTQGLGRVLSLDPFVYTPGGVGPGGLGVVYSLDPFMYQPSGLGALGLDAARQSAYDKIVQSIVAKGENCNEYLTFADTYTRLSQKDKSKDTIQQAKELAALFQQKYAECVDRKATAAVQGSVGGGTAPVTAPPLPPVVSTVASGLLPTALTAAQSVLQRYAGQQQVAAQTPAPQTMPMEQPAAPAGWMTPKTLLMIGGGVLAIGLVIYLMRRK